MKKILVLAKSKNETYDISMSNDQLKIFLDRIKDLVSINQEVKLKINVDNILMYSLVGEKTNVNAFKSFIISTKDIFSFKSELLKNINFIIDNGKKFDVNFRNFLDYNEPLDCKIFMNDDEYADNFLIKNKYLKLSEIGGDPRAITVDVDIETIKSTINKDNSDFKFILPKDIFNKIKKMSKIELENDILNLNIKNNKLSISENRWELSVCDIEQDDMSITFPKKYFNSIQYPANKDEVEIFVFERFLLVDNDNTSLLVALELTI